MMNNRKISNTNRFVVLFPIVICLGVYPQLEMTDFTFEIAVISCIVNMRKR